RASAWRASPHEAAAGSTRALREPHQLPYRDRIDRKRHEMIRIHNSLTGRKEALAPITPGRVRMYVCGITVYDHLHIGHARMMIVFDMVQRYLRHRGLELTFVRNITDIDDKIIRRAAENGETIEALTERYVRT